MFTDRLPTRVLQNDRWSSKIPGLKAIYLLPRESAEIVRINHRKLLAATVVVHRTDVLRFI